MPAGAGLNALTPRELQVLDLVAAGLDNRMIGNELGISEKAIRNRVSAVRFTPKDQTSAASDRRSATANNRLHRRRVKAVRQ